MKYEQPLKRWGDLRDLKDEDDNPQNRKQSVVLAGEMEDCFLLEMIIKNIDPSIKVLPFTHSKDLLHLLDIYLPDLLIMDLEMPCKQGADCLRMIRENASTKDLNIVIYSRSSRPSNRTIALELGANGFLEMAKPLAEIRSQVNDFISGKGKT